MQKFFLISVMAMVLAGAATAQNLNTPNKTGPMGLQVNTLTGNLFFTRADVVLPGRDFPLLASFTYNSFSFEQNHGFGRGWSCHYLLRYQQQPDACVLIWGDGREDRYAKSGGQYTAPAGFFSRLQEYQPGKLLLTQKDGTRYFFDNAAHRRLTRIEDPNGHSLTLSYTDTLLTALTNSSGLSLSMTYNSNGWLSSLTDAQGTPVRTWTYQYDAGGNLTRVTDPTGKDYRYSYLANGPLREVQDRNGNVVNIIYHNNYAVSELIGCNQRISFAYDESTLTSTTTNHMQHGEDQVTKYLYSKTGSSTWLTGMEGNCCGFKMKFEYDEAGNKIKETDANGNSTSYRYDAQGNVTMVTNALGHTWRYTYTSDFNNISTATDPRGNTTLMSYDARGNLLTLTDAGNRSYTASYASNGDLLSSTDPKGNVYSYQYDAQGNPTEVTGPQGYKAVMAYDSRGRLLSYTNSRNQQSQAEYDILNRLKKLTDPLNQAYSMQYDANGNLVQTTNPASETMRISYDASNRPVVLEDAMRKTSSLQYDEQSNVTQLRNVLNQTMQLTYDKQNRLRHATNALGEEASFEYDNNGNLTLLQLPNGRQLRYLHDALDRLVKMEDNHGTVAEITYDENDNVTSVKNGTGATTSATYDALNRPIQITDPLGNSITLEYDANGRVKRSTDRNGNSQLYEYDGRHRLVKVTDQLGASVLIAYDANSNVSSLTDQNGHSTTYQYDALNRVTRTSFADGKYMAYTYDIKSNLASSRLTDGSTVLYSYDTLNRLVAKTLPDGRIFSYTYDALGRVLSASNDAGTVSFGYDQLNRVTSETFKGRTVNYSYNTSGRTQTTTYPDGTVVAMEYDTRNRRTRVLENGSPVAHYSYNAINQVLSRTLANGISSQYQYDVANRLIGYSSGSLQQVQISYDKQGNKIAIERLHAPQLSERFSYDANYRLTGYQRGPVGSPNQQHSYSYDALGNRVTATINGILTNYSNNNLNQLTQTQTGASIRPLLYDDNGNLRFDGVFYKTYDAEKRLLKDSASPTAVYGYRYDALGRRTGKVLNGQAYEYSFSGMMPVLEYKAGQLVSKQVYSGFLSPLSIQYQQQRYYYLQDDLGSVESITNSNGRLVERYEYDPFGKQRRLDSTGNLLNGSLVGNRIGFTGQEYDSATASNSFYFRNYNPDLGVFQQRDLIGYADGMGLYQYVGNNPANGIDPFGLKKCKPQDESSNEAPTPPEWALNTQLTLDMAGNTGLITSLIDMPRAFAENSLKLSKIAAVESLLAPGGSFQEVAGAAAKLQAAERILPGITKLSNLLGKAGPTMGFGDLTMKGLNYNRVLNSPNASYGDVVDAQWDIVSSGGNLVGGLAATGAAAAGSTLAIPGAVALGSVALLDLGSSFLTGKSLRQHHYDHLESKINESVYQTWLETFGLEDSEQLRHFYNQGRGEDYIRITRGKKPRRLDDQCPQNSNGGGTRRPSPYPSDPQSGRIQILGSYDPNEIIGPVGQPDRRWVSVNDRLPYRINFENDTSATAPAKAVRITAPIHPNLDAAKFELGSFGFNSLSFAIPSGTAAYYQRLDCRDSLGLFVDITAGYDVQNKQAFWLLQSIDPLTLQTPTDPLKGLLLLQDSTNPNHGHGFVSFSIKPGTSTRTRDTVMADTVIIFDENDPIATNKETNTIDALPPTSQLAPLPATSPAAISLSWSGHDDAGGSGLRFYSLYISEDGSNYSLLRSGLTRTDTVINGKPGSQYFFFVLATDTVGNTETLRPGAIQSTMVTAALPVTWLRFMAERRGPDALLQWSTVSEQNSKHFVVERSNDAQRFTGIGTMAAAGFSQAERSYRYTDAQIDKLPATEWLYYRLRQVDLDGRITYSAIVRVAGNKASTQRTLVYPNPTQAAAYISLPHRQLVGSQAQLFDQSGKLLQNIRISSQLQVVDLSNYVNGVYYIKLANKEILRVVKQR